MDMAPIGLLCMFDGYNHKTALMLISTRPEIYVFNKSISMIVYSDPYISEIM